MKAFEDEIPDWSETALKKNRQIKALVITRQEAAARATEAEEAKKDCSARLLTIFASAGVDKCRVEDFTVTIVTTERNSLSEGALKKELLEGGMKLGEIERLWEKCSTQSKSSYIKVTERRQ